MTAHGGILPGELKGAVPLAPKGRLAENVVHFVRVLRAGKLWERLIAVDPTLWIMVGVFAALMVTSSSASGS